MMQYFVISIRPNKCVKTVASKHTYCVSVHYLCCSFVNNGGKIARIMNKLLINGSEGLLITYLNLVIGNNHIFMMQILKKLKCCCKVA